MQATVRLALAFCRTPRQVDSALRLLRRDWFLGDRTYVAPGDNAIVHANAVILHDLVVRLIEDLVDQSSSGPNVTQSPHTPFWSGW